MKIPSLSLPDPQTLLDIPVVLARAADGVGDLTEAIREELELSRVSRNEARELREVSEDLLRELRELKVEIGWVRANLEQIQDRVPGLSPPGVR